MGRTDHTAARTIRLEPRLRLRSLALTSIALALARVAAAQVSADAVINQPFALLGNTTAGEGERLPAYTYGIDAGIGETDNVTLAPTNKVSQTLAETDADFSVNRESRLFDANALGNFSYIDYLQGAYGPELLGRFDGTASAAIVPERLIWMVRDDFGQSALDPYTPVTPTNIENINYLTTGPELRLRFGGLNFLDVSSRYGRTSYQTSPFDSNRGFGYVALGRQVSAGASMSLDASAERVMFTDTAVNADFTQSNLYARYELLGARTRIVAEVGVSKVDQASVDAGNAAATIRLGSGVGNGGTGAAALPILAEPGGSRTSPLAKLQLTRRISPASTVILTAGQSLTNAGSSFSTQNTGATGIYNTFLGEQTTGSYRDTYATAGWQYQRNRTTFTLTGRWEKEVYPGLSSLDVTMPGAQFNLQRRLSHALSVQLLGSWIQTHYPHAVLAPAVPGSTEFANSTLGGSVIWRHGRYLEVRLRLEHQAYATSNGNTGYHESRVLLTLGYRPTPASSQEGAAQDSQ